MSYFQKRSGAAENQQNISRLSAGSYASRFRKNQEKSNRVSSILNPDDSRALQVRNTNDKPSTRVAPPAQNNGYVAPKREVTRQAPCLQRKCCDQLLGDQGVSRSSMEQSMQKMMEAESMEELLNSSINQFERYLDSGDNLQNENYLLIEQNAYLKNALNQLKLIIREKLESALKKQKEELSRMLEEYISMISKLLRDKEDFTVLIEQLQQDIATKESQHQQLQRKYSQTSHQVDKTKEQINEFLTIINQYEQEASQENTQMERMRTRISELEGKLHRREQDDDVSHKAAAQTAKIQTLFELLERSHDENNLLKEELSMRRQGNFDLKIQEYYKAKLEQLEHAHEEEFLEYDRAISVSMSKKDAAIERLTALLEGKRKSTEDSFLSSADIDMTESQFH